MKEKQNKGINKDARENERVREQLYRPSNYTKGNAFNRSL